MIECLITSPTNDEKYLIEVKDVKDAVKWRDKYLCKYTIWRIQVVK